MAERKLTVPQYDGMSTEDMLDLLARYRPSGESVSAYTPAPFTRAMNWLEDKAAGAFEKVGASPYSARGMAKNTRENVDFFTGLDSGTRALQALQARGLKPDLDTALDLLDASTLAVPLVGGAAKPFAKAAGREVRAVAERVLPKAKVKAPRLTPTFEVKPGANTGQPDPANAAKGRWDRLSVTGGRKDALYRAAGYKQGSTRRGTGAYRNSRGEMEYNPVFVGDVELPGGLSDPQNRKNVEALEALRALLDAQEAGAAHTTGEEGVDNAVLLARSRLPRGPEMEGLSVMGDLPYMATSTHRGALAFPYDTGDTSRIDDVAEKLAAEMKLPGARPQRVSAETAYVPGLAKGFDENYNVVASEPFSGQATEGVLRRLAEADDDMTARVAGDRGFRRVVNEKIARDDALPGARQDLQETRRLFADPRWQEALHYIRLGATPAAALAAIGYSTSALAGER